MLCVTCMHLDAIDGKKKCGPCFIKSRAAHAKWRAANIEEERARVRAYHEAHKADRVEYDEKTKERRMLRWRHWYERNKVEILKQQKTERWRSINQRASAKYRAANPEKRRALDREYRARVPWVHTESQRRREATKLRATPKWVDVRAIQAIYAEAAKRTAETGIFMHVDHIVPLRGKSVSGLHVPWNLQILTARENITKGARY